MTDFSNHSASFQSKRQISQLALMVIFFLFSLEFTLVGWPMSISLRFLKKKRKNTKMFPLGEIEYFPVEWRPKDEKEGAIFFVTIFFFFSLYEITIKIKQDDLSFLLVSLFSIFSTPRAGWGPYRFLSKKVYSLFLLFCFASSFSFNTKTRDQHIF